MTHERVTKTRRIFSFRVRKNAWFPFIQILSSCLVHLSTGEFVGWSRIPDLIHPYCHMTDCTFDNSSSPHLKPFLVVNEVKQTVLFVIHRATLIQIQWQTCGMKNLAFVCMENEITELCIGCICAFAVWYSSIMDFELMSQLNAPFQGRIVQPPPFDRNSPSIIVSVVPFS